MKLTNEEIQALKALAQLAPAIVKSLSESVALPSPPAEIQPKKRGRPPKQKLVKIENTPKEEEGDEPPLDKKEKEDGRHVRANKSPKLKKAKTGVAARREPMQIKTRVNLFDTMPESKAFKDDTKIDKKLWKGKQLAYRGERTTLVAAECSNCHGEFEVSPNEIKKDYDGGTEYICNDCLLEKRQ